MLRALGLVVLLLVAAAGGFVLRTLRDAGSFRDIAPHFEGAPGSCRRVPGVVGAEDLTIDPETGVVYVSASDRRAAARGEGRPGGLFAWSLRDPDAGFRPLTPDAGLDFQPHGLSLWRGADGRAVVFVINHPLDASGRQPSPREHRVEVFDQVGDGLVHRATLRDAELLVTPNDLVAVGPDRFYVTNTHAHPPGRSQTLESYLQLAGARVVFFDGERFRPAIEELVYPNGINVSADGRRLYVASTTQRQVLVFERDPATERLTPGVPLAAGVGLDNIEVDDEGRLWIGAHPMLLRVPRLRDDPAALSPSQVLRLDPETGALDEILLDDGSLLSGSSVAARWRDQLVVGQIFDDGLLHCRLR